MYYLPAPESISCDSPKWPTGSFLLKRLPRLAAIPGISTDVQSAILGTGESLTFLQSSFIIPNDKWMIRYVQKLAKSVGYGELKEQMRRLTDAIGWKVIEEAYVLVL